MDLLSDAEDIEISVNEKYAKAYEHRKEREELQRLEDKLKGRREDDSESDDESTEDEEAEELTPAIDAQIFKTVALIRNRDPTVYDPERKFFEEDQIEKLNEEARQKLQWSQDKANKEKPVYIKDYHRQTLLEGKIPGAVEDKQPEMAMTHQQELDSLKSEFKKAIDDAISEDSDDEAEEIFKKKPKTIEEVQQEEEEYRKWLVETVNKDAAKVDADSWIKSIDDDNEKFLLNYVFQKGWIESRPDLREPKVREEQEESDIEEVEKTEEFEQAFNFRFEEIEKKHGAGTQFIEDFAAEAEITPSRFFGITTHAREVPESIRKKENARALKRKEKEERKRLEKQKELEEIKRLKNLKQKEIKNLVDKVQNLSQAELDEQAIGLLVDGLGDDFDPEKYDEVMSKVFNDSYYETKDKQKPEFSDDDDEQDETAQVSPVVKEKAEAIEAASATADAEEVLETKEKLKTLLVEYDSLNYEDIVDGVKTRFRYRPVEASSFGLKPEEILEAEDSMLNEYLSLKKIAPYRTRDKDIQWLEKWKKGSKKRRKEFRAKLRHLHDQPEEEKPVEIKKKRKTEEKAESSNKKSKLDKSRLEAYGL